MKIFLPFIILIFPILSFAGGGGPGWGWQYSSAQGGYGYTPTIGHSAQFEFLHEQGYRGCSRDQYRAFGIVTSMNFKSFEIGLKANFNPTKYVMHLGKVSAGSNLYPMIAIQGGVYKDGRRESYTQDFFLRPGFGFAYVSTVQKAVCFRSSVEVGYTHRFIDDTLIQNGFSYSLKAGIGINFLKKQEVKRFHKNHGYGLPDKHKPRIRR